MRDIIPPRLSTLALLLLLILLSACESRVTDMIYQEGMDAFNRGDFANARDRFEVALATDSTYAKAHLGQGILYWRDNNFQQALPHLNAAIRFDPSLTMAYYYRGISLLSLHQYEQSLADFDKAIAANVLPDEDLVRAHQWHGIALLNLERYEEALPDFTRCVELQPDNSFHRIERGRVYEAAGQTENAIADYTMYLDSSNGEGELAAEARQRLEKLSGVPAEELQK